ncbi:hypothetical protein KSP35_08080 [Aquihabitans sp. G128]|uniref:hypothetical protein n=1 Tax=Aquihabitans sp. G128 TaxID=2849779 RepID=UPI001C22B901|nr:hypothetical protein [Aquihabitans sp. G128]QXC62737.1 hypothetical protein KSP35_08080 [Aquihabitans sp. G128]
MTVVVVIEGVVVAVLALLVVGLLRSHAEILKRLHELGAGLDATPAQSQPMSAAGPRPGRDFNVMPQVPSPPDREAFGGSADLAGIGAGGSEAVTVRVNGVEHDTIVAFLSSGCITCQKFWDAFRKPRKLGLPAGTRLVVVTKGADAESPSEVAKLAPPGIPTLMSTEAFAAYDVPGSPYFVQVHGPTGRVKGEGTGPDWDQVSGLLSQATGDAELVASLAGSMVAKPDADAEREARIDRELFDAGVAPGDASLYTVDGAHEHDHDDHAGHDHG